MFQQSKKSPEPTFLGTSVSGQKFLIDGINVWDFDWNYKDIQVEITDPLYKAKKKFSLFSIILEDREIEFIAGEFSNSMWGFYKKP